MPQNLDHMRQRLDQAMADHEERTTSFDATFEHAARMVEDMPLIHRTGDRQSWRQILDSGRLQAMAVGTSAERALGQTRAVYAFLGSGAYPRGSLALVLDPSLADQAAIRFTPFDTGALGRYIRPRDGAHPWNDNHIIQTLETHQAHGACLYSFAGPYIWPPTFASPAPTSPGNR